MELWSWGDIQRTARGSTDNCKTGQASVLKGLHWVCRCLVEPLSEREPMFSIYDGYILLRDYHLFEVLQIWTMAVLTSHLQMAIHLTTVWCQAQAFLALQRFTCLVPGCILYYISLEKKLQGISSSQPLRKAHTSSPLSQSITISYMQ